MPSAGSSLFPIKATNAEISPHDQCVFRRYAIILSPTHPTKSRSLYSPCSTVAEAHVCSRPSFVDGNESGISVQRETNSLPDLRALRSAVGTAESQQPDPQRAHAWEPCEKSLDSSGRERTSYRPQRTCRNMPKLSERK